MPRRIVALSIFVTFLTITYETMAQLTAVKIGPNAFTDETVFYLGRDTGIFRKQVLHRQRVAGNVNKCST